MTKRDKLKDWLIDLEKFARQRQLYHKRRAKQHPEEYPDYKGKK